ncbi:hypothetical protein FB451DRAFT_1563786 [Mycena latifolia]|nr:hypothetical protein FB451DRAFT_1563786 [Mycena latifolia]
MPPKKKKSVDGAPRPRGRPKTTFIARGRQALNLGLQKLMGRRSPTPDPSAPGPESESGGVRLTGEAAREAALANEEYGVRTERHDPATTPVWLQHIDRAAKGWRLIDTTNTEDIPKWFEDQKNDYQRRGKRTESRIVSLTYFGHPGDSPHDIRARKFIVRWSKQTPTELRARAIAESRPVWRWLYICAGVHDRPPVDGLNEEADEKGDESTKGAGADGSAKGDGTKDGSVSEEDESGSEEDEGDEEEHRGRWKKCAGGVQLSFEVTADDLAVVKIWQLGKHEEALPSQYPHLMVSRMLRLQIMDRFRRFGAKVTAIQRDLVQRFLRNHSSGASDPLPDHRVPTTKQIRAMQSAGRQRERLDRNPFRATHLMVKRNPRDIYTPHDFTKDDSKSKFTVAITDDFSLDSTIINTVGPNGTLFMDSTHRLQNENRAATTVLCSATTELHMAPGAYLISANIKAQTIKDFLVETIWKIEARAKEVAADKSKIEHRDPATRDRIFERCQHIAKHGFDLTNFNIDKSRSEYNGIIEALRELGMEGVYIRLCQFHVIQALIRFDADSGRQGLGFAIPTRTKFEIIVLFRILQRCRSWDNWEETKRVFHLGLTELLGEADRDSLAQELVPIMWPASLAHSAHFRFPTYVFPSERALHADLESHAAQVVRYLTGQDQESAVFTQMKEEYFKLRSASSPESPFSFDLAIFPGFKWTTVPAHEGLINHLSSNILATIRSLRYPHSFSQLEPPAQQDLLDVADNVGPVSLWVAYIARSLELDPLAVYQAMKDGQIDWTQTEAEELWAQYLEVLDDSPRDDLFDNLQIVVPDIMGPHPALR